MYYSRRVADSFVNLLFRALQHGFSDWRCGRECYQGVPADLTGHGPAGWQTKASRSINPFLVFPLRARLRGTTRLSIQFPRSVNMLLSWCLSYSRNQFVVNFFCGSMNVAMPSANYKKHTSVNPIQQLLIRRFYAVLLGFVKETGASSVLDAGSGEGFTLDKLYRAKLAKRYAGFDASEEAVKMGNRMFPHLRLVQGDMYTIPFASKSFDLVVCCEVLEHLSDPKKALAELCRVSGGLVMLTVPWEPWFQLSNFFLGKYVSRWGNHPEHVNHWTKSGFVQYVRANGLTVLHATISFPWIIVLAKRP